MQSATEVGIIPHNQSRLAKAGFLRKLPLTMISRILYKDPNIWNN